LDLFKKALPFILIVIGTVVVTKVIDYGTDNIFELEKKNKELLKELNKSIEKYNKSELKNIKLEKQIKESKTIIKAYETKNDSAIDIMHHGTREQRDSVGTALVERLLARQHNQTSKPRSL